MALHDPALPPDHQGSEHDPAKLIPVTAEDFDTGKRRVRLLVAAAVLLAVGSAAYAYKHYTDPLRAAETYDAAERLFRIARYTQAIVSLDRALSYKPDFPEAYLLRGRARAASNDLEDAVTDFTKVIELQPSDPKAYLERARALMERKKLAEALQDCEKVTELDASASEALNIKGAILRLRGDLDGSLAELSKALALEKNLSNYLQRGATYQAKGEHRLAIADFDKAVAFDPMNPQPYFARANSRRDLGDTKGAEQDHRQGRILDGR